MNYKKLLIVFTVFCAAVFLGSRYIPFAGTSKHPVPVRGQRNEVSGITLRIDTGTTKTTYTGITADTAYDALVKAAGDHAIPIEKKTYSFGVFVEKIGALTNTKERAWIYSVNGVSGNVAADKRQLKSGDTVAWSYTKPSE